MSDQLRELRHDLRPLVNRYRGARLIIGLFVFLFMGIFVLGFVIEMLKSPEKQVTPPTNHTRHDRGAR